VREQATETMVMHASPDTCFDTIVDFEHYAEWAADVKSVEVEARDSHGRGTQVSFRVAAFGRSTTYALAYDYSKAPLEVSWCQTDGDLTSRLEGHYVLRPTDEGDTEVIYHLDIELRVPIPGFVKRRAEGRIIHTALTDLRARVERQNYSTPPPSPR
jgi:ribosome-associated toxin RatA of RatAB toxin-antitoxin module